MVNIGRFVRWRAAAGVCLGALALLVYVMAYTDALLSLRLHALNVVFHRGTHGNIDLTFKPDVTQIQVEKAVAYLDHCKESQNVRHIYLFGKGVNSAAIHELSRLHGVDALYADGCTFSGDAVDDIAAWQNLNHVSLYGLKCDPRLFCGLAVVRHLERLDFDGKCLTNEVIECLSAFEHLDFISLHGDDVNLELVDRLKAALPRASVL